MPNFWPIWDQNCGRVSAEISAEASVNLAEISVSAETDFSRFGRSLSGNILPVDFTTRTELCHILNYEGTRSNRLFMEVEVKR